MGMKLKRRRWWWWCNHVEKKKRRNCKALRVYSDLNKCQVMSLFSTSVQRSAEGIHFVMKVEDSIRQWKLLGLACHEFVMSIAVLTALLLTFQALLVCDRVSLGDCFPDISKDCCVFLFKSRAVQEKLFLDSQPLTMKAEWSFKTLGTSHPTTWHHTQENSHLNSSL